MPPNRQRNGRIQIKIRRLLIIADRAMTTTELLRELYPGPRKGWHYVEVYSAARKFCIRAGRSSRGSGRPILWQLKPPELRLTVQTAESAYLQAF